MSIRKGDNIISGSVDAYTKSEADTLLNQKQPTLVSGTTIKTINNESILGPGNINIQAGGGSEEDNLSITKNTNNKIQTVGVINQNNTAVANKTWVGTLAEYEALPTHSNTCTYYITDDTTGGTSVYTKTEVDTLLEDKQDELVSGTNIKTINGTSILGTGDIEVGGLQNTATGSASLTILGTPTSSWYAVNIGKNSTAGENGTSIGYNAGATGSNSIGIGKTAVSTQSSAIAIGNMAHGYGNNGIAIGNSATADTGTYGAIQIGPGTNSETGTMNVGLYNGSTSTNYKLLGSDGNIPTERLSNAVTKNNISNCITEIPQDIKVELNNGILTLKAGSKVYVPNGSGVFDVVNITTDKTFTYSGTTTGPMAGVFFTGTTGNLSLQQLQLCSSGTTPPTGTGVFYNTSTNEINFYSSGTKGSRFSFPICLVTFGTSVGGLSSIDQVFNGFGYIGSTVFALPGVKGLIPDGRNEDGSLKSIEFTTSNVLTNTGTAGASIEYGIINKNSLYVYNASTTGIQSGRVWYEEKENELYVGISPYKSCIFANIIADGQTLKSVLFRNTFRALDYNDKGIISGWGMPGDKYINLTLGASGSTYTAPASGWFFIDIGTSGANQYCLMRKNSAPSYGVFSLQSSYAIRQIFPIKKGETMRLEYNAAGTLASFLFIYAEGET